MAIMRVLCDTHSSEVTLSEDGEWLYVHTNAGYAGRTEVPEFKMGMDFDIYEDELNRVAHKVAREPQATTEPGSWDEEGNWKTQEDE